LAFVCLPIFVCCYLSLSGLFRPSARCPVWVRLGSSGSAGHRLGSLLGPVWVRLGSCLGLAHRCLGSARLSAPSAPLLRLAVPFLGCLSIWVRCLGLLRLGLSVCLLQSAWLGSSGLSVGWAGFGLSARLGSICLLGLLLHLRLGCCLRLFMPPPVAWLRLLTCLLCCLLSNLSFNLLSPQLPGCSTARLPPFAWASSAGFAVLPAVCSRLSASCSPTCLPAVCLGCSAGLPGWVACCWVAPPGLACLGSGLFTPACLGLRFFASVVH